MRRLAAVLLAAGSEVVYRTSLPLRIGLLAANPHPTHSLHRTLDRLRDLPEVRARAAKVVAAIAEGRL